MSTSERLPNGLHVIREQLEPEQQFSVSTALPLVSYLKTEQLFGIRDGVVIAQVWPSRRGIVHIADVSNDSRYPYNIAMIGDRHRVDGYAIPVSLHDESVIGRAHEGQTEGLGLPDTASRNHFSVKGALGGVVVRNMQPTNATVVNYASSMPSPDIPVGPQFIQSQFSEGYANAPQGFYQGRRILSKDTHFINGSIVMGTSPNTSFVIDGAHPLLDKAYSEMVAPLGRRRDLSARAAAVIVSDFVRRVMIYDEQSAATIASPKNGVDVRNLSEYVHSLDYRVGAIGVHFAALAAYFGERIMIDEIADIQPSLERNVLTGLYWAIFANKKGDRLVVDPANNHPIQDVSEALAVGYWQYSYAS